jgi:hypothetical protein
MHIHMPPASSGANALAGAQAAETATALRRARELREAASKLKADSLEINSNAATTQHQVQEKPRQPESPAAPVSFWA